MGVRTAADIGQRLAYNCQLATNCGRRHVWRDFGRLLGLKQLRERVDLVPLPELGMLQHRRFSVNSRLADQGRRLAARRGGFTVVGTAAVLAVLVATGGGIWWCVKNRDTSNRRRGNSAAHGRPRRFRAHRHRARRSRGVRRHRSPLAGEIEQHDRQRHSADRARGHGREEGRLPGRARFVGAQGAAHDAEDSGEHGEGGRGRSAQYLRHGRHRQARVSRRHLPARAADDRKRSVRRRRESQSGQGILRLQPEAGLQGLRQRELQLEADRFAVEKANKDLDTAKTKLKVLDEFTKPKMVSTLESAILIAKAKWESAQNSHELELEKLAELDDQIAKCTIVAPQDGVVKYAHVMDGRGDQEFIVEEGAVVRERQVIITLAERRFDARQSDGQRIAGAIRAAGAGGRDQPGRVRRPRAARRRREGQSIRRADRLAAGERQGIQGVREHRRADGRFAGRHDGRGDDSLRRSARCAAGARASGLRPRRQVLLLRLRPGQLGSARSQSRARRTTSSS